MTYFEGWFGNDYVVAEDWYQPEIAYVEVRQWFKSTRVDSPDVVKSFLIKTDDDKIDRIKLFPSSIAHMLSMMEEQRGDRGVLIPITVKLPALHALDLAL